MSSRPSVRSIPVEYAGHLFRVHDVARQAVSRSSCGTNRVGRGRCRGLVQIERHHVGALATEHGGNGAPDSRSGPGDDRDFPRELKQGAPVRYYTLTVKSTYFVEFCRTRAWANWRGEAAEGGCYTGGGAYCSSAATPRSAPAVATPIPSDIPTTEEINWSNFTSVIMPPYRASDVPRVSPLRGHASRPFRSVLTDIVSLNQPTIPEMDHLLLRRLGLALWVFAGAIGPGLKAQGRWGGLASWMLAVFMGTPISACIRPDVRCATALDCLAGAGLWGQ